MKVSSSVYIEKHVGTEKTKVTTVRAQKYIGEKYV